MEYRTMLRQQFQLAEQQYYSRLGKQAPQLALTKPLGTVDPEAPDFLELNELVKFGSKLQTL
jgi:hypothetical protein